MNEVVYVNCVSEGIYSEVNTLSEYPGFRAVVLFIPVCPIPPVYPPYDTHSYAFLFIKTVKGYYGMHS